MKHAFDVAESYLGLEEFPGAKHNPAIVKMFADSGHAWVTDDETPWCAAFVGSVLAQCGMTGTGGLNARSYETWGEAVDLDDARPGDIVVLWRKGRNSPYGHVAFYAGKRLDKVKLLGGNQGNAVSVTEYPVDRVVAVRRAKASRTSPVQSKTLQASTLTKVAAVSTPVVAAAGGMPWQNLLIIGGLTVVILIATGIIDIERVKKWRRGIR